MERDRGVLAFGVFTLIVGVVLSYFIVKHPQNLNPEWPLWMALVASSLFTLGGLHMIGAGLGKPRFASAMIVATMIGLLAVANYAAFLTEHYECRGRLSFLGFPVATWYPTEEECVNSLRILMTGFDAFILFIFGGAFWLKHRSRRKA